MLINNPFGTDELDITEDSAAVRVGRRIRAIRTAKGLTQAELGAMVGLTADRVQKYENGIRKPKSEMLKNIARALGVSSLALADPTTSSYINAMFALFELENNFNMRVEKIDSKLCLSINSKDGLYPYINDWYNEYTRVQTGLKGALFENEKTELMREYKTWQWTYPRSVTEMNEKELQKMRLKSKIEELQEAYNKLDSE